jgi:hypothetical protein
LVISCVVEVDGKDRMAEVSKQTRKVIELLEVPITEKLGLQGLREHFKE